ncbi:Hypothetical predicted protein, partial [Pelobates cultripes]
IDGTIKNSQKEITQIFTDYYQSLYNQATDNDTRTPVTRERIRAYLLGINLPKLQNKAVRSLEAPIMQDKIEELTPQLKSLFNKLRMDSTPD